MDSNMLIYVKAVPIQAGVDRVVDIGWEIRGYPKECIFKELMEGLRQLEICILGLYNNIGFNFVNTQPLKTDEYETVTLKVK